MILPEDPNAVNDEILEAELIRDEGDKLKAYKDTAPTPKWTIGTGRNLDRPNKDGTTGITKAETALLKITRASALQKGITKAQSKVLRQNDIAEAKANLDASLPWWRRLDLVRQRVLVNMCFNLGIKKLLQFSTTLSLIRIGKYAEASEAMLDSRWADQVGDRAKRLSDLMRLGPQPIPAKK